MTTRSVKRSSTWAGWRPVAGISSKRYKTRWQSCRMRLNITIGGNRTSSNAGLKECRMKNLESENKTAECRIGLARAIRHSLFVILLGILCLLVPAKSFGQSPNRWLFIFNTSSTMKDRTKGVQAVTQDLLTTAMHGNLRNGDTIGLWTYNNVLRAEEAPLQTWDPDTAESIARNTVGFMSRYHYEKTAAFGDVLTNMLRVIKISEVVTVILVSDGNDPIKGTPFDDQLS